MARKLYLVHSRIANSHSAGFGLSFHLAVSSLLKLVKLILAHGRSGNTKRSIMPGKRHYKLWAECMVK